MRAFIIDRYGKKQVGRIDLLPSAVPVIRLGPRGLTLSH